MKRVPQDPPADAQILRAIRALRKIRSLYMTDREKAHAFLKPLWHIYGPLTYEQHAAKDSLCAAWDGLVEGWGRLHQESVDDIVNGCLKDIRKEYPQIFDAKNRCLNEQA